MRVLKVMCLAAALGSAFAVGPAAAMGSASSGGPASVFASRGPAFARVSLVPTAAAVEMPDSVADRLNRLSPIAVDDVVWLARCIYSESDRPHEQRLVAWVVRNRVETGYRGSTYREVILEARQFSAFNEPTPRRGRILNLTSGSTYGPWRTALQIALDVYQAPAAERPFPRTVRHFYSPISMRGGLQPHWADSGVEISSTRLGVDPYRFRFFNNVDEDLDAGLASSEETGSERLESSGESGGGFLIPVRRRSGRVARPLRPTVRRSRDR